MSDDRRGFFKKLFGLAGAGIAAKLGILPKVAPVVAAPEMAAWTAAASNTTAATSIMFVGWGENHVVGFYPKSKIANLTQRQKDRIVRWEIKETMNG